MCVYICSACVYSVCVYCTDMQAAVCPLMPLPKPKPCPADSLLPTACHGYMRTTMKRKRRMGARQIGGGLQQQQQHLRVAAAAAAVLVSAAVAAAAVGRVSASLLVKVHRLPNCSQQTGMLCRCVCVCVCVCTRAGVRAFVCLFGRGEREGAVCNAMHTHCIHTASGGGVVCNAMHTHYIWWST
jgi:hypothetical protein